MLKLSFFVWLSYQTMRNEIWRQRRRSSVSIVDFEKVNVSRVRNAIWPIFDRFFKLLKLISQTMRWLKLKHLKSELNI